VSSSPTDEFELRITPEGLRHLNHLTTKIRDAALADDVGGDAVNVASRMESTVALGRIQVPQSVYEGLNNDYLFEERGDIDIKGNGVMHTWYLLGRSHPSVFDAVV
jgi:class 3 adenylate cyclase